MLRTSRFFAALLATATLTLSVGADARTVSASFEARFTVVATCSVSVDAAVQVDCASPATPYLLHVPSAPSLRTAGPDAGRVTVYF
ncbi:hypothetical protein AB2N08_10540 [Massilia aurea]|uniref:hypothetical protein n=1 Tax=Massilia aurea TaxID=373040 RepID=UPI003462F0AD